MVNWINDKRTQISITYSIKGDSILEQEEEDEAEWSFNAMDWRLGIAAPYITHHFFDF